MLGDTAVAVHPDDERYKNLVGKFLLLPIANRRIPIVADTYSDPEKGTGAVKITPAHDFNDFEVGRRHNLPLVNIFDADAKLNDNAPGAYRGLDRFAARDKIVAEMESLGLLEKVEDNPMTVPHGDRSGVVIEPWLTDQWYVNAAKLAEPAIKAVEEGRTQFVPKHWENTLFRMDAQHSALVHLAPDLVGPSSSGVVRPGRPSVRRHDRRRRAERCGEALRRRGEAEARR